MLSIFLNRENTQTGNTHQKCLKKKYIFYKGLFRIIHGHRGKIIYLTKTYSINKSEVLIDHD